jgi:hypothetical protein
MNCHRPGLAIGFVLLSLCCCAHSSVAETDKIQIAFLLDVSGSMDQLILKAKSQFWRMANYVGAGTKKGKPPIVEFALVIYGGDSPEDRTQIITDFNSDLDSVAIDLHEIRINGSTEHCWTAINTALDTLNWSKRKGDLKLIIIAGNESFVQEKIDARAVTRKARKLSVTINTIYCDAIEGPINEEWKKAAEDARGNFFTISLGDSLNLKENFMDWKLSDFNDKFNESYLPSAQKARNDTTE